MMVEKGNERKQEKSVRMGGMRHMQMIGAEMRRRKGVMQY